MPTIDLTRVTEDEVSEISSAEWRAALDLVESGRSIDISRLANAIEIIRALVEAEGLDVKQLDPGELIDALARTDAMLLGVLVTKIRDALAFEFDNSITSKIIASRRLRNTVEEFFALYNNVRGVKGLGERLLHWRNSPTVYEHSPKENRSNTLAPTTVLDLLLLVPEFRKSNLKLHNIGDRSLDQFYDKLAEYLGINKDELLALDSPELSALKRITSS